MILTAYIHLESKLVLPKGPMINPANELEDVQVSPVIVWPTSVRLSSSSIQYWMYRADRSGDTMELLEHHRYPVLHVLC